MKFSIFIDEIEGVRYLVDSETKYQVVIHNKPTLIKFADFILSKTNDDMATQVCVNMRK